MKRSTPAKSPATPTIPVQESALEEAPTTAEMSEDQVRSRAYQLYEQRGREDGHAAEDWLQAEAEIYGKSQDRLLGL